VTISLLGFSTLPLDFLASAFIKYKQCSRQILFLEKVKLERVSNLYPVKRNRNQVSIFLIRIFAIAY
jgi:hypothetical protein